MIVAMILRQLIKILMTADWKPIRFERFSSEQLWAKSEWILISLYLQLVNYIKLATITWASWP